MKKIISFSAFAIIVILSLLAKSSMAGSMNRLAQNQGDRPTRSIVIEKPFCKTGSVGHWKWNRRFHNYIWVEGRRIHSRKVFRTRHW